MLVDDDKANSEKQQQQNKLSYFSEDYYTNSTIFKGFIWYITGLLPGTISCNSSPISNDKYTTLTERQKKLITSSGRRLTKIHTIKINNSWTQVSFNTP